MTAPLLDRPMPAPATTSIPGASEAEMLAEGPNRQLELALTDLAEVLAVYPFRSSMPVCDHCVDPYELRMLGRQPGRIPSSVLDRYVTKALITWGEDVDFKRLLPEILTRACRGDLGAPETLVGARMRRAGWLDWPAAEAPAVRRTLRAAWLRTLSTAPGPGRPPAMARLGLIVTAEDDLSPYLDLWEDRLEAPGNPAARLHAVLHLADLLAPLANGGRRRLARSFPLARRGVVGQLDQWLRLPVVIRRLAHAADALEHTPQGTLVTQARSGLSRLRTER
ncbi:hypothetical protein HC251_17745 [Iamia sp. SCSIO 61187]|uniref:hypothetical protein n=1 Tax=Iamia sp. SCSIO 61187 TaxID=2722752 RepID=UPI001C6340D4|nr:hypothetical protein [Iamia sp. SCSIO 61187]QYG94100.1 hypothetical protein HC251_17745 [Iamia sp. SCSIO 61187]